MAKLHKQHLYHFGCLFGMTGFLFVETGFYFCVVLSIDLFACGADISRLSLSF